MDTKKVEFRIDCDDRPSNFADELEKFMRKNEGVRVIGFKEITSRKDIDLDAEFPHLVYELEYEE